MSKPNLKQILSDMDDGILISKVTIREALQYAAKLEAPNGGDVLPTGAMQAMADAGLKVGYIGQPLIQSRFPSAIESTAPEAPPHLDNSEASAWQSGWTSGYEARANSAALPADEKGG
jgi:hypothetical protein